MEKKIGKSEVDKPLIKSDNLFPVVGIGASAGGLNAFKKLLKAIPLDSGMAFVLVQHLDPNHESLLPEILQKVTKIPVVEIADDIKVEPNHIYVIPSNKMMVATDGVLLLAPRPEKSKTERNLPIDLFFNSLAQVHQTHAIGVVLSGTATDGTLGLKAIKDYGGITFAQDEASAEYDGMPSSAVQAGVVDFILPPEEIPEKLLEVTRKIGVSDEDLQNIPQQEEDVFKQILSLLRIRKGVDFTYYKQTTIRRRILRRMVVNKNEEPTDYLKFLRLNNQEQDLLYQDMLIPVTSFFRDPKTFENLCVHVFPSIIKNKIPGEITRIWVAGCSTGEEVYSFAICFKEFLAEEHERIQIFGTDLSEPAIAKARAGIYEKNEVDAVSQQRLQQYFTKTNGSYQVNKSIRDMCIFAHHNFLKDPPFGKMDCISCRNVLIYMEPFLQKKALTTFHYALNPKGFLLLGKSETTGGVPDLFASATKNDKLFTRKDVPGRFIQVTSQRGEQILSRANDFSKKEVIRTDFQKTADDILLTKYTPAGVIVTETMDIVHFRGNTRDYLEQAPGKPSHNLLMMAKYGLSFELRNILHKAKTDKKSVIKENIPLQTNGNLRNISIEAIPLPNTLEPYYLILFHDNTLNEIQLAAAKKRKTTGNTKQDDKDIRIKLLEQELAQAREDMRSITEDQEASNEELQSANEELLSGSEELQSLNEELETSKEELQSTNEELTVLNHELISLNEQVTDARNYSESIVATLYQPLLVLDKHLRVKTANQAFYKTFKVNEQETEGVLIYDLGNRQWNIPELRTLLEEILPQKKQISDFEVTHNFLSIGERIILLSALEITREKKEEKLILLSIEDITESKAAANKIEESEKRKAFLLRLSDAIRPLSNPVDIEEAVTKIALDFMDADWCHYCTIQGDNLIILRAAVRGDLPSVVGEYHISNYPLFNAILDAGRPFIVDDVHTTDIFDEELRRLCVQLQNISFINVPVIKNGKPVGLLSIVQSRPRKWTDSEVQLTIETAERTWAAVERATAEEALRKNEEKYRSLFNSIDQGFALCELVRNEEGKGIDFRVLEVNPTYEKQTGVSMEMVVGKTMLQVFPAFDTWWIETYTAVVDNQCPVVFEHYFDVSNRWFAANAYPNEKDRFAILFNDITERKQADEKIAESEKQFKNVLLQSPGIFAILKGPEMVIDFVNESLLRSWGRTNDIVGKTIIEALPEMKDQAFPGLLEKVYKTGETYFGKEEKAVIMKDGRPQDVYYNYVYQPTYQEDGTISGITIMATDITEQVIARRQMEDSNKRYDMMVMQSPFAFAVLKGKDMVITLANDSIKEMWGKGKEIEGKPLLEVLPEIKDQPFPALLDKVYTTGNPFYAVESPVQLIRNGKMEDVYFNFVYQPYREADETISGVAIIASEVTPQAEFNKKIKESETRFRTLIEDAPVATCFFTGREMTVEIANDKILSYWGKGKNVIGKTLLEAVPELKGQPFIKILDEVFTTGKIYEGKNEVAQLEVNSVLGTYYFDYTYKPIFNADGEVYGIVNMAVDVTEQVLAKNKYIENQKILAKQLEEKVQERTMELNKSNLELEKINKELHAFTYVASHDLQEPLRKIQTFAGLILEKENLSDKGSNYFRIVREAANRMQQLIHDLLAFSIVKTDQNNFEKTDLTKLFDEVITEFKEIIEEKNAVIEPFEMCEVTIIPFQLRQVMQNLIGNALKFSNPDRPPHLIIKSKVEKGSKLKLESTNGSKAKFISDQNYCHISIADNGIGFEPEFNEKIFEVFQRLHSKDEYPGTGIGLAIVKKIVENHSGEIYATGELNKGARFDIYLPVNLS